MSLLEIKNEEIKELEHKIRELKQQLYLMEFLKEEYYYGLYAIRINADMNFSGRIKRIRNHLDELKIKGIEQ